MFEMKDSDYKCSLSEETLKKAKKELGETPDTRLLEVNNLRSRVIKTPGLKARTDIKFLLPFLRVCKFDQEKAYQRVKTYYQWKRDKSEVFDDLKPSRVQAMLDSKMLEVLKGRDKQGCRVIIWRAANWDEDRFPTSECLKLYAVMLLKMQQEEETQVHGIHFIIDLHKLTLKQSLLFTPSVAKFYVNMSQNVVPLRLKRIDYINYPGFWEPVFLIFKQFMKEKIAKRVGMNGNDPKGLYSTLDPEVLPSDLGGKVEPCSNQEWRDSISSSEREFEEDNKFGFLNMLIQKERKEGSSVDAGLAGMGGTFKKLDIS